MNIYLSKQPIFDAHGNTCCYELLYRASIDTLNSDGEYDRSVESRSYKQAANFFTDNEQRIFGKKHCYMRFSPEMLKRGFAEIFSPEKLTIEITLEALAESGVVPKISELKRMGYDIAIDNFLYSEDKKELFKLADVVRFDVNSDADRIKFTVEKCHESGKHVMAADVETADEFETARDMGIDLFEGFFFAKPVLETKRSGGPMIKNFLQILALLYVPDPDMEQIAAIISTDPVLTIRLLKLINKLCEDTGNTISTVKQALIMLGLDNLKEWIYLVGLQRLNRNSPNELLRVALFRAGFCERLSKIAPGIGAKSKEMYLMGLISIVTGTSGAALADALKELPVSDEIRSGLIGNGGIYSDIYNLSFSVERGFWDDVDKFAAACGIKPQTLCAEYMNTLDFISRFNGL